MRGLAPIGMTTGWMKSFTNIPTLATQHRGEWTEVNGATISDVESPLNGQTLPDINGINDSQSRFIRGNDTSGGTGATCHCHTIGSCYYQYDRNFDGCYCYFIECLIVSAIALFPRSYTVVFIVRFK